MLLTEEQIQFLNRRCLGIWRKTDNGINVEGNVDICNMNLQQIPVQFGHINGHFNCSYNELTSLENSPITCNGYFACGHNNLTDLIGAPEICDGDFYCNNNFLISLKGCTKFIVNLNVDYNKNLEFIWGTNVKNNILCSNTKILKYNRKINIWIHTTRIEFPYYTLQENINWIKSTGQYSCLLAAPQEIRQMFSKYELDYVDTLC